MAQQSPESSRSEFAVECPGNPESCLAGPVSETALPGQQPLGRPQYGRCRPSDIVSKPESKRHGAAQIASRSSAFWNQAADETDQPFVAPLVSPDNSGRADTLRGQGCLGSPPARNRGSAETPLRSARADRRGQAADHKIDHAALVKGSTASTEHRISNGASEADLGVGSWRVPGVGPPESSKESRSGAKKLGGCRSRRCVAPVEVVNPRPPCGGRSCAVALAQLRQLPLLGGKLARRGNGLSPRLVRFVCEICRECDGQTSNGCE